MVDGETHIYLKVPHPTDKSRSRSDYDYVRLPVDLQEEPFETLTLLLWGRTMTATANAACVQRHHPRGHESDFFPNERVSPPITGMRGMKNLC